jgi:hypothetical protein
MTGSFAQHPASNATTTLESAAEFGLTQEEILETVIATLDRLPSDTKARCIDEIAGALAHRLIEKQREF